MITNDTLKNIENIKKTCLELGQAGLLALTEKFDKIKLESFIYNIPNDVNIDKKLKTAIGIATENIFKFHKAEYDKLISFENDKIETSKNITCWKKFTPIEKVGIYIPNKLFSSVLMNIIPAKIANCKDIVVCTPPQPSNEILYTLQSLGISKIYTIGGAQAIFAMSYGIGEIPKVDKIFGPGNEFVDFAKRIVSNDVAIDMPAGPSEVLVIADNNANQNAIIYDILAQLEHGRESKAWLFSTNITLIKFIEQNIINIAAKSSRYDILKDSIKNLIIKEFNDINSAITESNQIAPEHLILNVERPNAYLHNITNAGSVFIGQNTPESLGDYISGTNHVLPTNGSARAFSGLSVLSFGKFITFQVAQNDGLSKLASEIAIMAESEGLEFHAKSVNRE